MQIDVKLFYYEEPKEGQSEPAPTCSNNDFYEFRELFKQNKEEKGEKSFEVDTYPGGYNLYQVNIFPDNIIVHYPGMFYDLSYPIIGTKNPNALMPMDKILDIMKKGLKNASTEEKTQLIKRIESNANYWIMHELGKHSRRRDVVLDKQQFIEKRLAMLKQRLKSKFGLFV